MGTAPGCVWLRIGFAGGRRIARAPVSGTLLRMEPSDADAVDPLVVAADVAPGPRLFNRELSWLDFNHRVLELAGDDTIPLLERLRF